MKFTNLLNLVCIAIISWNLGVNHQRKKDLHVVEESLNEFKDSFKEESPKKQPYGKSQQGFVFRTHSDAEKVLDRMQNLICDYGVVTINDLYDLVGADSYNPLNNTYGWTNLENSSIRWSYGGYLLGLPLAKLLH